VAKLFARLVGRRSLALVVAVLVAALAAKGHPVMRPMGFFDGPH
jgi:hypothetical protein